MRIIKKIFIIVSLSLLLLTVIQLIITCVYIMQLNYIHYDSYDVIKSLARKMALDATNVCRIFMAYIVITIIYFIRFREK